MKTEIQIEIQPFTVPGYVEEVRAFTAPAVPAVVAYKEPDPSKYQPAFRTFSLRELSTDDLCKLCSDFTDSVFKAAGKNQPPRKG